MEVQGEFWIFLSVLVGIVWGTWVLGGGPRRSVSHKKKGVAVKVCPECGKPNDARARVCEWGRCRGRLDDVRTQYIKDEYERA